METTKRQQMTMIFSFALRSKAVAFQKELERLGIASRKISKLRHEYAVTTDTRAMDFAAVLNKFIYEVDAKHKEVAK
jgi:hypothetical protein